MQDINAIHNTSKFIKDAKALIAQGEKESRIRENFTSYLRLMFPEGTKWIDSHVIQGETSVKMKRNGNEVSGFIDNCIDNIAIEYEKNLNIRSIFLEGYRQVKEYCAALVNAGTESDLITGILSDTLNWYVYKIGNSQIKKGDFNEDNIELLKIDELHIKDSSSDSCNALLSFLSKYLGQIGNRTLNARSLSKDFGIESKYTKGYINAVVEYVDSEINKNKEYYLLIQQLWCTFVDIEKPTSIHKNIIPSVQHTYSLEFYIAVIAKLLAANLITHKALISNNEEIMAIIRGEFFENQGIYNFAEYDYFGWLTSDNLFAISPILKDIQSDLAIYDFSKPQKGDLFGLLLVQLANKHHRLLLGQELTPIWVSELIVKKTISLLPRDIMPKFVDMCCGSGSMIVATINETKKLAKSYNSEKYRESLLSCCTGFDIDPLATILAKINWLINISDSIDIQDGVYIPIYLSDSLFLSSLATGYDDNFIKIDLYNHTILIPSFLFLEDYKNVFDIIVNKCHDLIDNEVLKEDFDNFISYKFSEFDFSVEELGKLSQFSFDLYSAMYVLNKEGKNGLWSFIIKNSLRPNLIKANFNGIVSNTPWLALSKIADNPYKLELTNLARKLNILPRGESSHHLELATTFLVTSVDRYINENGVFGCILPHTVLNGNHHKQFRIGAFAQAKHPIQLDFTDIWILPEDLFKNKSIVVFGKKDFFTSKASIPGKIIENKEVSSNTTFSLLESGKRTIWSNEAIKVERHNYSAYKFLQGADIMPRSLFFFNLNRTKTGYQVSQITVNSDYSYFLKDMKLGKDFKVSIASVPKDLFVPVILSNSLLPYKISHLPLALLPVHKNSAGIWQEYEQKELSFFNRSIKNLYKLLYKEFQKLKPGKDLFKDGLNCRNKLSNQNIPTEGYLVVYGAGGSKTCAAFLELNETCKNLIIDQTIYYTIVATKEEAQFMTGLLNSNALYEANSAFQAEGALGKRHLHTLPASSIPKYDPNNSLHREMSNLTETVMDELNSSDFDSLLNPNSATVSVRRTRMNRLIENLPSYERYNEIAYKILLN